MDIEAVKRDARVIVAELSKSKVQLVLNVCTASARAAFTEGEYPEASFPDHMHPVA